MLRGLYTAGTAMIAQSRRMDVITNNLVNVETAGYKGDVMVTQSFKDMLISRSKDPSVYQYSYVGPHNTGIHIDTIKTDFTQGALTETGHTTDLALDSDAFFVVEFPLDNEDGESVMRYTRAGNFTVDSDGYLVTPEGYYVQGQGGNILIGTPDFDVSSSGVITVNGEEIDTIRTVRFEDNNVLRKTGGNLYKIADLTDEDGEPLDIEPEDVTATVKQGFLEASNVDVARDTVRMMEVYRSYEINQRILKIVDDLLGKAVNEIAKV